MPPKLKKDGCGEIGKVLTILMAAEKPMYAKAIANILSNGKYEEKLIIRPPVDERRPRPGNVQLFQFKGQFRGQPALFKIVSTYGHLVAVRPTRDVTEFFEQDDFHDDFVVNVKDLLKCELEYTEANWENNRRIPEHLLEEAKDADIVILWTDHDKPGEAIGLEVLDAIYHPGRHFSNMEKAILAIIKGPRVYRAHFSVIFDEEHMKAAMENLTKPNWNWAIADYVRTELDLRLGLSMNGILREFFCSNFEFNRPKKPPSCGPCQSPILNFIVRRSERVKLAKVKPSNVKIWTITLEVELPPSQFPRRENEISAGNGPQTVTLVKRFDGQQGENEEDSVAWPSFEAIRNHFDRGDQVEVLKNKKVQMEYTEKAMNTCEAYRKASQFLNLSSNDCSDILEKLYVKGFISYPRTSATSYPPGVVNEFLGALARPNGDFSGIAREILRLNSRIRNSPSSSHAQSNDIQIQSMPIVPLRTLRQRERSLSADHFALYKLVVQHFLISLMPLDMYQASANLFESDAPFPHFVVANEEFSEFQDEQDSQETLMKFHHGMRLKIRGVRLEEKAFVSQLQFLPETELISLLEQYGIGSPGKIPSLIAKLLTKDYVKIRYKSPEHNRLFVPTNVGIAFIQALRSVVPEMLRPEIRRDLEAKLELIASGKTSPKAVKEEAIKEFTKQLEKIQDPNNRKKLMEPFKSIYPPRRFARARRWKANRVTR